MMQPVSYTHLDVYKRQCLGKEVVYIIVLRRLGATLYALSVGPAINRLVRGTAPHDPGCIGSLVVRLRPGVRNTIPDVSVRRWNVSANYTMHL